MAVCDGIIETLDKAQNSAVHHSKLLKSLKTLHDATDLDGFFDAFVTPLCAALVIAKKAPVVERVLDFVAKFAASVAPLNLASEQEDEDVKSAAGDGEAREENEKEEEEEARRESGDTESSVEGDVEEEEELDHNFFNLLLLKLLSFHKATSKAIRFRSCQLVAKMLNCVVERNCRLQSTVLEAVEAVMLERIRDKIPAVRVHAAQALELLQEDVSVQLELVKLLEGDTSADVRKTVLGIIVITDYTLPAIISRTRDVKDQIRKAAFLLLSEKCSIRNLRIEQRIKLLDDGLNDRSEMVRSACVNNLLHSWSCSLGGDLLSLLTKLDVESSPEVAELALTRLLAQIDVGIVVWSVVGLLDPTREESGDEGEEEEKGVREKIVIPVTEKVVPYNLLNSEEAFYWSCVCRYLHNMGDEGDAHMEKVVPTVSEFCEYVQCYVESELIPAEEVEEKMQKQFVCQQLLSIFSVMDLSDEVGKRRLAKMVLDLLVLPRLPTALVSPLLTLQTVLWPQPQHRVEKLLEVISDLRQPPLSTTLCAGSSAASVSQSTTLLSETTATANLSLLDIHSDPDTLAKCLTVATEMLKELKLRRLPVNLKTMIDVLILPCIQNELPDIRDVALGCLGLACLHDIALARNHLLLFLQVSQVDHESVQATAVKVVFDLLLVFGFEAFNLTSPANPSSTKTPEEDDQHDETLVERNPDEEEDEGSSEVKDDESGEGNEEGEEGKEANKTTQRILTIMANFIDGESLVLREIAAEGMAKLLLSGRVISQKLLARLLVLWLDPSTQEEARLRAVLGLFFPAFATADRSCRVMLGEVFIPVLEMVSEAPPSSPLRNANLNQIADFLVHLTAPREPNEDPVHDSLAMDVANAVLSEPDNSLLTRVYCRALTHMQLTTDNQSVVTDLLVLLGHIETHVPDKRSLQYVRKVTARLNKSVGGGGGGGGGGREGAEEREDENTQEEEEEDKEGVERDGEEVKAEGESGEREDKDNTLVASTPPRQDSPTQDRPAKKSTVKRPGKKSTKAKASTKKAPRRKRKITISDSDDSSSDFSGDETLLVQPEQISALPSRIRPTRAAKASAVKLISDSILVTPRGRKEEEEDESDDSLVGDHSPFVRQPARRTGGGGGDRTIPVLDYDDD